MRILAKFFLLLTLTFGVASRAYAAEPDMLTPDDQTQIAALLDRFADAWHRRDMDAFATLFTEDADWINIVGMHWKGRNQVVRAHHTLIITRYKGVDVHNLSHEETEIAPGVALVFWVSSVDGYTSPEGRRIESATTRATLVLLKQQGNWLIRSGENVIIDAEAAKHDLTK